MLHFSNWKISGILLVLLVGIIFSLPNFMSENTRLSLPDFIPSSQLNLGLDLQGGSHLLLQVDTDAVTRERIDQLVGDIRLALREERIGYTGLGQLPNGAKVTIRDEADKASAQDLLRGLAQPVVANVFGGFNQALDLDVSNPDGLVFHLTITDEAVQARNTRTVQQSMEIIRLRVDELGTTEPTIQRQGDTRILVQVPGLDDPERLKNLLGQTAKLSFHLVDQNTSGFEVAAGSRAPAGTLLLYTDTEPSIPYLVRRRAMVSGEDLVEASIGFDQQTNAPEVYFRFNALGGKKFGEVTKANVGRPFAIVLDNKVISAPVIQTAILGGSGRITGNFSVQEANDLAILLRAGALPAPMQILEERTVGPSLGAENIALGVKSVQIGLVLVVIFMILYYRVFGIAAVIALTTNLVLLVACMSLLGATLTLPGIAGIVLTVGMAVDANVLIFARIREELARRMSPQMAINSGFERAVATILDANITTLIVAVILYAVGTGPIKGFAVTLSLGILTSMFTAILGTRALINLIYGGRRVESLSIGALPKRDPEEAPA